MIKGHKRKLPSKKIEVNAYCSLHNRFDIEVIDSETGKLKQKAQAENVICTQLWTRLFTPANYFNYIFFGTGVGTPSSADTSLFTHAGYKAVATPTYTYDTAWLSLRQQCQLLEAEYVGSTLTEVGIGYGTSSSNLVTHAMLKDMNGNQVSIAKTNTDIINIYATVFVHWSATGYGSGFIDVVEPVVNPFLAKYLTGLSALQAYNGSNDATIPNYAVMSNSKRMFSPINTGTTIAEYSAALTRAYSSANKTITLTAARIPVAGGNFGGYSYILIGCSSSYGDAVNIGPIIACKVGGSWFSGSSITGEAIGTGDGTTKDFSTDFDFPTSATIYVDGVEASGVTVDNLPLLATHDMGRYFEWLPSYVNPSNNNIAKQCSVQDSNYNNWRNDTDYTYWYNPYYSYGITSFYGAQVELDVSNDLTTWTNIINRTSSGFATQTIPTAYKYYKYWRIRSNGYYSLYNLAIADPPSGNIHFTTAPTSGAVITADYTANCIAKDENHVFDFSAVITLGEYTA